MSFLENQEQMMLVGNLLTIVSLVATCSASFFYGPKLPAKIPDFWSRLRGDSATAPKIVALLFLPLLAIFMAALFWGIAQGGPVSEQADGFWVRLVGSLIFPVLNWLMLGQHARKAETANKP